MIILRYDTRLRSGRHMEHHVNEKEDNESNNYYKYLKYQVI